VCPRGYPSELPELQLASIPAILAAGAVSQVGIPAGLLDSAGMTRRAALNVSLTPELVAFVASQVASGRYASASEVVRAALRCLERDAALGQPNIETLPS
jgi:putative addiction module CopG family antidote